MAIPAPGPSSAGAPHHTRGPPQGSPPIPNSPLPPHRTASPAWVPREGSRSADASITTARDMRSAWIQQFQLISSPILQQFSEPVGCFCHCKRPFSCMVAPFPFPALRRIWGTVPVWLDPSSGSSTTISHTSSSSVQSPAPHRAAGMPSAGHSPAYGDWDCCLHGAPGSASSAQTQQGTFGTVHTSDGLGFLFPPSYEGLSSGISPAAPWSASKGRVKTVWGKGARLLQAYPREARTTPSTAAVPLSVLQDNPCQLSPLG